jgi:hypothetical protein
MIGTLTKSKLSNVRSEDVKRDWSELRQKARPDRQPFSLAIYSFDSPHRPDTFQSDKRTNWIWFIIPSQLAKPQIVRWNMIHLSLIPFAKVNTKLKSASQVLNLGIGFNLWRLWFMHPNRNWFRPFCPSCENVRSQVSLCSSLGFPGGVIPCLPDALSCYFLCFEGSQTWTNCTRLDTEKRYHGCEFCSQHLLGRGLSTESPLLR